MQETKGGPKFVRKMKNQTEDTVLKEDPLMGDVPNVRQDITWLHTNLKKQNIWTAKACVCEREETQNKHFVSSF